MTRPPHAGYAHFNSNHESFFLINSERLVEPGHDATSPLPTRKFLTHRTNAGGDQTSEVRHARNNRRSEQKAT